VTLEFVIITVWWALQEDYATVFCIWLYLCFDGHREVISESKLSIYDTCFIWKALKSYLVKKDKAIIFIWLATCDLTTKTGKYIELTHNTSRYHNKIDAIASKLSTKTFAVSYQDGLLFQNCPSCITKANVKYTIRDFNLRHKL
jgi:hypothetical protein